MNLEYVLWSMLDLNTLEQIRIDADDYNIGQKVLRRCFDRMEIHLGLIAESVLDHQKVTFIDRL